MTKGRASALAAAILAGCGSYPGTPEEPPLMVVETGKTIELQRGKRVTVRLEANRSAGYRWSLAFSGDGKLEQLGEAFYAAEKSVPGGDGAEYWPFRATRAGTVELRFEYRRPWEHDKPVAKGLSYTIEVR
jgi:predicted secreted protein